MMSIYMNRPEPRRINIGYCCIDVRIGTLAGDGMDVWWDLLPDDNAAIVDQTIGEDLVFRLHADAFRFFDRFKTPQDVLRFLEEPRSGHDRLIMPRVEAMSLCYAAILATLLGFRERSATLIKKSLTAGRKNPGFETYQDVERRLLEFEENTDRE